jgi:membrane protein
MAAFDTIKQDGVEHAGYLAFLSILSLFPFLIILISIVGFIGESQAGIEAINQILSLMPSQISAALYPRISEIISEPSDGYLTIAIIGIIWTASSSVEGCRTILNRAYRVRFPPPYLFRRLLSIAEFFVITFFSIIGILVFVIFPNLIKKAENSFDYNAIFNCDIFCFRYLAIFFLLVCSTSLLYFFLPNAKQKFSQTVPGSILTVILWFLIEKIFSYYLSHFKQFNIVYGSLAGIIISLTFFYLISLIFILGAEFNYHFHRSYKVFLNKKKVVKI